MSRMFHAVCGCLLLCGGWLPAVAIDIAVVEAGASGHARQVGAALQAGDRGAIGSQPVYGSMDWLTDGFLHAGDPAQEPEIEHHDIQNHSWVGQSGPGGSLVTALDALHRLDHAIVRDGFTAVVSLENRRGSEVPELLGHAYNVITVGRLDGMHSRGGTWLDGIGRTKPDLVGVLPATSLNVPAVSAAAALLMRAAEEGNTDLYPARRPEVVKAILLASATKDVLPAWEASPEDGLDAVYGAGVLDPASALAVLATGPRTGDLAPSGWDVGWTGRRPSPYRFSVPAGTHIADLSLALVWNRMVEDLDPGPGFVAEATLADLNLVLYSVDAEGSRQALHARTGAVNNVEYLYLPNLTPGRYALDVTGDDGTPYALAWHGRAWVDRLDPR